MLCLHIVEHTCYKAEAVIFDTVLLYIRSLPWKQPKSMRGLDVFTSELFVIVGIDLCSFVPFIYYLFVASHTTKLPSRSAAIS